MTPNLYERDPDRARGYLETQPITWLANLIEQRPWLHRLFRELTDSGMLWHPQCQSTTRTYRNYYVVDTNPIIVLTSEATSDLEYFSEHLGSRSAHFIRLFWWSKETHGSMYREAVCYRKHQRQFPHHKVYFLCNTQAEKALADRFHLPAIFCNHNALLDEHVYSIQPEIRKQYDVIYNARLDPAKRHLLLSGLRNVALIIGPSLGDSGQKRRFGQAVKAAMPSAVVLNDPSHPCVADLHNQHIQLPMLSSAEVATHLNSAKVGIILSRIEGACYASAEYLLCGLPVVTTHCMGGREVFLQGDFVRYVRPTCHDVRCAVEELAETEFDPQMIRQITLERMALHRQRFCELLQSMYDAEGKDYQVADKWEEIFINKMIRYAQPWPDSFTAIVSTV